MNLSLPDNRIAVKICGLTNREDALAAIDAGADLLGFNTWTGTKRHIDLGKNADWISALPVLRVALLVNEPLGEAARVAALPYVDALQFHGDEDAEYCAAACVFGKPIIKAIRAGESAAFANADRFSTRHILLDALVPGAFGGTGTRVRSSLTAEFQRKFPGLTLWLAGGLTPDNVAEVTRDPRPAVVDVSSGVEREAGRKDFAKMRAFVTNARRGG